MRALIFLLAVSGPAWAEAPSARFTSGWKSEAGSTGLSTANAEASSTLTNSVDVSSGSKIRNFTLRLGLDRASRDYGRYLITDSQGGSAPLSRTFSAPEYLFRPGLDLYAGNYLLGLDAAKTLGSTPFPGDSLKVRGNFEERALGAKLFAAYARSDLRAPASYFVDPDSFASRLRPTRLLTHRGSLGWEQVLGERWKGRLEGFAGFRPGSRPSHRGLSAGLAYALTDRLALFTKVGGAREVRGSTLYEDRGYFDAYWAKAELRFEPSYRWSLGASAGTVLETETARGRVARQKVGTDSLGLNASLLGSFWQLGMNALGQFSNTGYHSLGLGGNFTWQL